MDVDDGEGIAGHGPEGSRQVLGPATKPGGLVGLDAEGEAALHAALKLLKQEKTTCIVITHRPSLLDTADKVLVLREGAVQHFGTPAEVLAHVAPKSLKPAPGPVATPVVQRKEG